MTEFGVPDGSEPETDGKDEELQGFEVIDLFDFRNLAELYRDQGRHGAAELLYRRAVAILEKSLGSAHPEVVETRAGYARLPVKPQEASDGQTNQTGLRN